jgi:hypothetical protein
VNADAIGQSAPLSAVQLAMRLAPWRQSPVQERAWTHAWMRHAMFRAPRTPIPVGDPSSDLTVFLRLGGWLRGKAETAGLGVGRELNALLLHHWRLWHSAAKTWGLRESVTKTALLFTLRGAYLHDALYPNQVDSFRSVVLDIWGADGLGELDDEFVVLLDRAADSVAPFTL